MIEDESDMPILQQWARAATDQGAALWVQLNHPGKQLPKGLNAALRSGTLDIVDLARLLAIDPDAPAALLQGHDSPHQVRPISTGINAVDRMGIMEILWYTLQLRRIADGGNPRPNESGWMASLKSLMKSSWDTYRTRRLRA